MNYTNVLEYALADMFLFYFETTATYHPVVARLTALAWGGGGRC